MTREMMTRAIASKYGNRDEVTIMFLMVCNGGTDEQVEQLFDILINA